MNNASQTENLGFTNFETRGTLRKPWSSLKNVKRAKKVGNQAKLAEKKDTIKDRQKQQKEQLKLEHKPTNVGKMALE